MELLIAELEGERGIAALVSREDLSRVVTVMSGIVRADKGPKRIASALLSMLISARVGQHHHSHYVINHTSAKDEASNGR